MSGIGDFGDPSPPSFPGTGGVGQGQPPPASTPTTTSSSTDSLEEFQLPEFLNLSVAESLNLPPGEVSLLELTKIISKVINELRDALHEAEFLDAEKSIKFHMNSVFTAIGILEDHNAVQEMVKVWDSTIKEHGQAVEQSHAEVEAARDEFNNLLNQVHAEDSAAVNEINQYIDIYNNPTAFENFANNQFGGDKDAALAFINGKIADYNTYMDGRVDIQAAFDDYKAAVESHNQVVGNANADINSINAERAEQGLPPIPGFSGAEVPDNVNEFLTYEGQLPNSLPSLSLPAGSTSISPVTSPASNSVNEAPQTPSPGTTRVSFSEAFRVLWLPGALASLAFLTSFSRILDLAEAFRDEQNALFTQLGFNIISPDAFIERSNQLFLDAVGMLGGGIGLGAFAMGLHARNLEISLSRAMFTSMAMNASLPITGRLFSRLQFSALQLLQNSALLSPLPALRFVASAMGHLGAASPSVRVALSLAISTQVMGAVAGGAVRSLVNAQINRMPFFARLRARSALRSVERAERRLGEAIASGHPGRIRNALRMLGNARIRLGRATRLHNSFGVLSIGGLASFTRSVAATMSFSVLSVAMAHFGRSIGLPNIVAQLFAQVSGVSTLDALTALTAGSRLLDVLDNPFSVLALKQTLVDRLVFNSGIGSVAAGIMVNSAINNIILRGGIYSSSHLRSELVSEFQQAGFNIFRAHQLANETVAMIQGDIGINFLSAAFGMNADRSIVASSIVNNILGIDSGIAGAMLSSAVTRSLMFGGFGSRVRLQNELTAQFQNLGLSYNDAYGVAATMVDFVETVGSVIPLSRFPGLAQALLGNPLLEAAAFGSNFARNDLINDFRNRGLSHFQAEFLADQVQSLAAQTFTRPGNLFATVLESALERAGLSFETQRDFRDRVFAELRNVGFSRNDALFLANSAAAFGLDGTLLSPFGVSAARLAAIEEISVNRIAGDLGVSGSAAQAIMTEARERALGRGPFSNEDQFQNVLREEFQRAVINHTGRYDGHIVFDRVVAELSDPGTVLSLAALTEQIGNTVMGILRPDLGDRVAREMKDQILTALLGGKTIDEIENDEQRNPLSVLHQFEDALKELKKSEEEEDIRASLRKLIQILQSLMTPNAEVGFLLQSLSDSPSTFIGSVLGSEQPKGEFLQVQA